MRNSFDVEVCFKDAPTLPYDWEDSTTITGLAVKRISTSLFKNILLYEGYLNTKETTLLLSDGIDSIVTRLDARGKILKRSFLSFATSLDVSETAHNLKMSKLEFTSTGKKIEYKKSLGIEKEMENYIVTVIKNSKDEDLQKYLYYLYYNDIEGYSKDKLIDGVKNASLDKNMKLYKFLIGS